MSQVKLASAFKGSPSEYKFTHVSNGKDHCACGHVITVRYHIVHPILQHELVLGCDCIETFEYLGPILEQVIASRKAAKALSKAAAEAALAERLTEVVARFKAIDARLKAIYGSHAQWHSGLAYVIVSGLRLNTCKSTKGKLKKASEVVAKMEPMLADLEARINTAA